MAKYVKFTGQYKQIDLTEGHPYKLITGDIIIDDAGYEIIIARPEDPFPCAHLCDKGYWGYCDYKGNSL